MPEPLLCPKCGAEMAANLPAGLCPKCLLQAGMESQPPSASEPAPTQSSASVSSSGFVPPTPEELSARFPQLEVLELLGKGGMGAVYKARQAGLDRLVALKILPPEVAGDPAFAERFTREARALAKLNHPNIVGVYDFGQANGLYYFIMEYVDGTNLRQVIQSHSLLPKDALAIVPQVCDALQYAHDEGVVHRDIKPENILLDRKGRAKIADFGLVKLLGQDQADAALTGTHQVMGTLRYMAPEQMEGSRQVDHRADIFSLGVVFYELLTGELPIGRFAPPSKKVQIDVRLDEVVLRALEKEPEQRYQHASEVKTEVEAIQGLGPAVMRSMLGFEYRSATTLWGWPLLHVVSGIDPATGRARVARGIVAVGDAGAVGGLAMGGGFAVGGVAIGGGAGIGLIGIGGLAAGLLFALGGLAVGGLAVGGGAIGLIALGGGALGYYAFGGGAWGVHALGGNVSDPQAAALFQPWATQMLTSRWSSLVVLLFCSLVFALAAWLRMLGRRLAAVGGAAGRDLGRPTSRDRNGIGGVPTAGSGDSPTTGSSASASGRLSANLAELAAVALGLGIFVPILLFMFTGDLLLAKMSLTGGLALAMLLGLLSFRNPLGRYSMLLAVVVFGAFSAVQLFVTYRQTPITYTYFGDTGFISSPDGPVLSDVKARQLGIPAAQQKEANRIFQDYYRQYAKLERQHTRHTRDDQGHVHITVDPFADEMHALVQRLRSEIGGIVDQRIAPPLPEKGKVHTQLGLFRHAGEGTVKAELWKDAPNAEGDTYFMKETIQWTDGGSNGRGSSGRSSAAFPEEYRLYWIEPD